MPIQLMCIPVIYYTQRDVMMTESEMPQPSLTYVTAEHCNHDNSISSGTRHRGYSSQLAYSRITLVWSVV